MVNFGFRKEKFPFTPIGDLSSLPDHGHIVMVSEAFGRSSGSVVYPVCPGTDAAGALAMSALRYFIKRGLIVASTTLVLTASSSYIGTVRAFQINF